MQQKRGYGGSAPGVLGYEVWSAKLVSAKEGLCEWNNEYSNGFTIPDSSAVFSLVVYGDNLLVGTFNNADGEPVWIANGN